MINLRLKKNGNISKICLNSRYESLEKNSITSKNYTVTYYQSLEEVPTSHL